VQRTLALSGCPHAANHVTSADLCASSPVRRGGSRLVPLRTPKSRRLDDIMADADRAGQRTAAAVGAYDSESDGPIPKVCIIALSSPSSSKIRATSDQMPGSLPEFASAVAHNCPRHPHRADCRCHEH